MRILIMSDTHKSMRKAFEIVKNQLKIGKIDLFIHLGDCIDDGIEIGERFTLPTIALRGNCDSLTQKIRDNFNGGEDFIIKEDEEKFSKVIKTPAGKIYLTHGHRENVNFTMNNLIYKMEEEGCIASLFGHTHMAVKENCGDLLVLNPGSLSKPRDDAKGSYAIMEIDDDSINCEILRPKDNKRIEGGYIKNLINYSDRF